jgi:hypothetical protein
VSYQLVGAACATDGCRRPVWDHVSGLCSPCWRLRRLTGGVFTPELGVLEELERLWRAPLFVRLSEEE